MFVNILRIHFIKVAEISLLTSTILQRHPKTHTNKSSKSVFKNYFLFLQKWNFLQLFFRLQWLQLPWKNALANIFLSRSRMVIITYFLNDNVLVNEIKILIKVADQDDINFIFPQKLFQLPGNAVKMLMCQNFVLGIALLLMLWQDKKKESPLVQNTIPLSRDAFKQLRVRSKDT